MAQVELTIWVQSCRIPTDPGRSKRLPCFGESCRCRGMGVVDAVIIRTEKGARMRRWPIPLAEHTYP